MGRLLKSWMKWEAHVGRLDEMGGACGEIR